MNDETKQAEESLRWRIKQTRLVDGCAEDARIVLDELTRLRAEVERLTTANRQASGWLQERADEVDRLKKRMAKPCAHLCDVPAGTEVHYLHSGRVYILGTPAEGDGHNCDAMGCGSVGGHVVRIVDVDEVERLTRERDDAQRLLGEATLAHAKKSEAREEEMHRVEAERDEARKAATHAFEVLRSHLPSGHDGDEDSPTCDEDCALCAFSGAMAHVEAATAPREPR